MFDSLGCGSRGLMCNPTRQRRGGGSVNFERLNKREVNLGRRIQ